MEADLATMRKQHAADLATMREQHADLVTSGSPVPAGGRKRPASPTAKPALRFDMAAAILSYKPELKPKTVTNYCTTLRKLYRACQHEGEMPDFGWLFEEKRVRTGFASLRNRRGGKHADSTQCKNMSHMIVAMRCHSGDDKAKADPGYRRWEAERDLLSEGLAAARLSGEPTENQQRNYVPVEVIRAAIHTEDESMAALLRRPASVPADRQAERAARREAAELSRYVMMRLAMCYRSRLDLATVMLCTPGGATDKALNYLEMGPVMRFVIHQWKTLSISDTDERIVKVADPTIHRLLADYIRASGKRPGDWLFTSDSGNGPLTRQAMHNRTVTWLAKRLPPEHRDKTVCTTLIRIVLLGEKHSEDWTKIEAVEAKIAALLPAEYRKNG